MKGRDYLWCLLHMMLDDEAAVNRLCLSCQEKAKGDACPVCGSIADAWSASENESFDLKRFETLGGGERL